MASVDLEGLPVSSVQMVPLGFGGIMNAALGGPSLNVQRLGDRWAMEVQTAPMRVEPAGRRWSALLFRGKRLGVILPVVQVDFDVGAPGAAKVSTGTAANGFTLPMKGLTPHYAVRAGQWLNYFDGDGQAYLDQVAEQAIADGSGNVTVTLQNRLRISQVTNAVIELADPVIEGWLIGDLPLALPIDRTTSFSFRIEEKA